MSTETILSLAISIPLSVLCGLFSGLVVARYQRFSDLRYQAKKVIWEIGFVSEGDHLEFPSRTEAPELSSIASELLFLKHREAAETLLRLHAGMYGSIQDARMGRISFEKFNKIYGGWQESIMAISPNMRQLLRLRGGL
ncbi:hypothetical protein [Geothrix sp. 21YS21S-4]|uniref:hypothetical protein n=1 Tax=Geothrix sp. 21YS21S-4 TaxID=3068889 RepID=UPI0027BA28C7|nr:hypothetical protein [Geothrix sp. 21YS21S-4]